MNDRFRFRAWDSTNQIMNYDVQDYAFEECLAIPNYPLMQCTGLKDRKGNLIYEGDLIKVVGHIPLLEVIWEQQNARFTGRSVSPERYSMYIMSFYYKKKEVVGNIFEHPHLLEDKK